MDQRKSTNFEACRDLQGRRLKTINEAKYLADYYEKEPERKKIRQAKIQKKIDDGLREKVVPKVLFDDQEYIKNHKAIVGGVRTAVEDAMNRKMGLKRKNQIESEGMSEGSECESAFISQGKKAEAEEEEVAEEEEDQVPLKDIKDIYTKVDTSVSKKVTSTQEQKNRAKMSITSNCWYPFNPFLLNFDDLKGRSSVELI